MAADHIEFIVEEPSMEAALQHLLPKLLVTTSFRIHPHQCKQDLLDKLPGRLRGYSKWLPRNWYVIVLVDRDDDDCIKLKKELEKISRAIGLPTCTSTKDKRNFVVANRLVIEELESWYFGDWSAVVGAYPRTPRDIPRQAKYRQPDAITGGTWECFERVLQQAGYFHGGFRKIEAANAIAQLMVPGVNTSQSFRIFHDTLSRIAL